MKSTNSKSQHDQYDVSWIKPIRLQTRQAIEKFLQGLLDHRENQKSINCSSKKHIRPKLWDTLWYEGLIVAYRLLFIVKLEKISSKNSIPSFAQSQLWQSTYSPTKSLGPRAKAWIEAGQDRGDWGLEKNIRELFAFFGKGCHIQDLSISPIELSIFQQQKTACLNRLDWGEESVAQLLDKILWIIEPGIKTRKPLDYERLTVEDLGRIYESLLELEPGITQAPMYRLRRPPLEVVVNIPKEPQMSLSVPAPIKIIESLPSGRFYLRAGLGRKTTGSYYTPQSFVRFLVQEALDPLLQNTRGNPEKLLTLRILDPSMGSGHFLVEACRYLGHTLAEEIIGTKDYSPLEGLDLSPRLLGQCSKNSKILNQLCRHLVVENCLYGVDQNELAVELSKLALWIESHIDGVSLHNIEHHLICGDSLTGAWVKHLLIYPQSTKRISPKREALLKEEICKISKLSGCPKDYQKAARDVVQLAQAWSGATMLESDPSSLELSYKKLLCSIIGESGRSVEEVIEKDDLLREMLEAGSQSIAFEFAFPDVFCTGQTKDYDTENQKGFDVVLGNPPWDKVLPLEREFYANYDVSVLTVPTARERKPIYSNLKKNGDIREAWYHYAEPFVRTRRFIERAYQWQVVEIKTPKGKKHTGGHGDRFRYFVERSWHCLRKGGRLGLVLPNALYSTEGATGIRRLLLFESSLEICLGFLNSEKLFEIGSGQRFCLVIAEKRKQTHQFKARFGLKSDRFLLEKNWRKELFDISLEYIKKTSPEYLCFMEIPSPKELEITHKIYCNNSYSFKNALSQYKINLYQEMNMTVDSQRFKKTADVLTRYALDPTGDPRKGKIFRTIVNDGWNIVHEKGTFHSYDDRQKFQPRYLCHKDTLQKETSRFRSKDKALESSRFYRLVARSAIHATEQEKSVFCMIPPFSVVGNSALTESAPFKRPYTNALVFMAVCNSRCLNFIAKLRLGTNLNQFLLESLPFPILDLTMTRFFAHASLILSCNHEGFETLWKEQIGSTQGDFLVGTEKKLALRAALDVLVAHAFGLSKNNYSHLLESFSGRTERWSKYIEFNQLCLQAFEELMVRGVNDFCRFYDPYWNIELSYKLPVPAEMVMAKKE